MTKEYEIRTIEDIADLTPEQQESFLVDLKAWLECLNTFREIASSDEILGVRSDLLIWADDGDYGRVSAICVQVDSAQ